MAHPLLKRLEKAGQNALIWAAGLLFRRRNVASPPDWALRPHRVLYLRYDRIGDMIMATGLIRAIATSHSGIELDVLASPTNAPVLEGNPYVRRVLLFDRRRMAALPSVLRELQKGGYDAVIDGMVMSPSVTMMLLMLATRAPYRIGIGGRKNDFVYTLPVPPAPADAHVIDQARQTATPFGVDVEQTDWRPELSMRPTELKAAETRWGLGTGTKLLVNVSAVTADRRWPPDRYTAVIREAMRIDPNTKVLVISAPHERAAAEAIAAAAGAEVAHTASVRDAFALVATADAVFTPDTSISHAAAALDVPVAVMMLPVRPQYGPYRARHVRIESPGDTLADLQVSHALTAMRELFALARA